MPTTQKDIAAKLNVSIMTVSKALKGHPDISAKTRKRVEDTAREMNYTVNVVARSLVQKRTHTIGVIVPDISELYYAEIVRGIEMVFRQHQYNILLIDSENDPDIELDAIQTLLEKRVDGLIFGPTEKTSRYINLLKTISIPYILINNTPKELDCDSISIDRRHGSMLSVSHLISGGYEDIYFLYTFKHLEQSQHSINGCYDAFDQFNLPREALKLVYCENRDLETFYNKTLESVQYNNKKTGVYAWDDEMAVGVYRALVEKGFSIPVQVGLVGFDDIRISKYLPKSLTTIYCPKFEMGKKCAERLLLQILSEQPLEPENIMMTLKLIKRETT